EVLKDAKCVYESIPKILSLRERSDIEQGSDLKFHAIPNSYDQKLLKIFEKEAKTNLHLLKSKVRRDEGFKLDAGKKVPGIQIKRFFGSVPMETQLYNQNWFNMYNDYHNTIYVDDRLTKRSESAEEMGLELVVKHLDNKLKDIFSFKF